MGFLKWAKDELGFNKSSEYQRRYLNETNIRTAIYMSFIVMILEFWMLIRYVVKRPGLTFVEYFDGETNYLIFFTAALVLTIFSLRYSGRIKSSLATRIVASAALALDVVMIIRFIYRSAGEIAGGTLIWSIKYHLVLFALSLMLLLYELLLASKDMKSDLYGQAMNVLFALICLGFGVETSLYDLSKSRQILCFITMMIFVVFMLIWRPYVSFVILGVAFLYFYKLWQPILMALDIANEGRVLEGDTINYFMLWIVMVMVSISIYQQRVHEAKKDEGLIEANEKLERVAVEDDLTGINNMFYFNQETEKMLKDPEVDISRKVFLFLNVENFKTYNDQFGYQAGNEYLTALALLICEVFPDDVVARQSDDHFVVFTDIDKIEEKTELVRGRVRGNESEVYLELKVGAYGEP